MNKRFILVLALALTVGMTFSAYAEVQNVKVSGDIIASGVARSHFNLANGPAGDKNHIKQDFFMSQVRLRIDADLTDNVAATVRLINERVWNGQYDTASSGNSNIDLDLAYVTLKEFLYSPLTLTVGRQEIHLGNGLIIGNAKVGSSIVNIPTDLSERKAFDAIRATLNYDPLVVDVIYAKVKESNTDRNNDINLAGINATYALNNKTDLSAYYFLKTDNNAGDSASRGKTDKVNTIGALVSSRPIENLNTSLEAAFQFGKNDGIGGNLDQNEHKAFAVQAMADYTFAKVKMTPKIGASYTYLSGKKNLVGTSRNQGWDPMFNEQVLNNIAYAIFPMTDLSVLNLKASCKPVEDVTLMVNYGYYDIAKKAVGSRTITNSYYDSTSSYLSTITLTGKRHMADEIDVTALYDYTEDVQFGLTAGWLKTGSGLSLDRRLASQVIGSMKVSF
ncbi:MAG: alginate export family protein [Candidatus Omnitrophota bacterium]